MLFSSHPPFRARKAGSLPGSRVQLATPEPSLGAVGNWTDRPGGRFWEGGSNGRLRAGDTGVAGGSSGYSSREQGADGARRGGQAAASPGGGCSLWEQVLVG